MSGLLPTRSSSDLNIAADINTLSAPPIVVQTNTNYTIADSSTTALGQLHITTGSTDRTITLPLAANNTGREITIVKIDVGAGNATIDGNGSEQINGSATAIITKQFSFITVKCTGTEWFITSTNEGSLFPATNLVKADGTVPFTANQSMGNNLLTNVATGTASGHAVQVGQIDTTPADSDTDPISSRFLYKQTFQGDYASGGADPWVIEFTSSSNTAIGSPVSGTWHNPTSHSIVLTAGTWDVYYEVAVENNFGTSGTIAMYATLSTGSTSESDSLFTSFDTYISTTAYISNFTKRRPITVGSNTTYYLNIRATGSGTFNTLRTRGADSGTIIRAQRIY